ncbi:hypothetical protein EHQ47_16780 [Leptospira bourretii]|nr:hypothetical protein EHQ47_16780 [Leptospira bourretii]
MLKNPTSHNSRETLRFGTSGLAWAAPHSLSVTRLHPQTTCQSLTSRRDSGSGNVVSPSSLIAMSKKKEFKIFLFQIFAEYFYSRLVKR